MFDPLSLSASDDERAVRYEEVRKAVDSLLEGEDDWVAAMATVVSELRSFTLKRTDGGTIAGKDVIDPVWARMVDWHGREEREGGEAVAELHEREHVVNGGRPVKRVSLPGGRAAPIINAGSHPDRRVRLTLPGRPEGSGPLRGCPDRRFRLNLREGGPG